MKTPHKRMVRHRLTGVGVDHRLGGHEVDAFDISGPVGMLMAIENRDAFQTRGAPCFEPPATDEDWQFLFGNDPEETYQP